MLMLLYLLAIVIANLIISRFGANATIPTAFLLIGLDLTARDRLHEQWRQRGLFWKMALLIAAGSALSYLLNRSAGNIALASMIAFGAAATVDTLTYWLLGDRTRLIKVNGSNVFSAAVDSLIFPALAFGLPLLLHIVIGQFLAKVLGGFIWSFILFRGEKEGSRHDR